jgi:hypothetical protein
VMAPPTTTATGQITRQMRAARVLREMAVVTDQKGSAMLDFLPCAYHL